MWNIFGGELNGVNCRRLMKHYVDIINDINEILIETSKCEVSDVDISKATNKYNNLLIEIDGANRCIWTLSSDDILIDKTRIHIKNTMMLWRELKLLVNPLAHLLEDHILTQMNSIYGGITNKIEDHIERRHQVSKRFEKRYKFVTDLTQSGTSQIKLQGLLSNLIDEMKLEQVKIEILRNFEHKRE